MKSRFKLFKDDLNIINKIIVYKYGRFINPPFLREYN